MFISCVLWGYVSSLHAQGQKRDQQDWRLRLTLGRALHEFVVGLVLLRTDTVALAAELVEACPAPRARLTVRA